MRSCCNTARLCASLRRDGEIPSPWLYPKVGYVLILLDLLFIAWSLLTHPLGGAGSTPVIAVNGR